MRWSPVAGIEALPPDGAGSAEGGAHGDVPRHRFGIDNDQDRGHRPRPPSPFLVLRAQRGQSRRRSRERPAATVGEVRRSGLPCRHMRRMLHRLRRGPHTCGIPPRLRHNRDHSALYRRTPDNARRVVHTRHRRPGHQGHIRRPRRADPHGDKRSMLVGVRIVYRDLRQEPRIYGCRLCRAGMYGRIPVRPGHALHRLHELEGSSRCCARGPRLPT